MNFVPCSKAKICESITANTVDWLDFDKEIFGFDMAMENHKDLFKRLTAIDKCLKQSLTCQFQFV